MLVKTLLIALVSFIGFLECGVGNSMIQRPIVMGPLVGLVLGDVNAGLAVGATLELAFMGNVTIGAAEVKVDGSSYRTRPLPIEIVNEGEGSRAQQQQGGAQQGAPHADAGAGTNGQQQGGSNQPEDVEFEEVK